MPVCVDFNDIEAAQRKVVRSMEEIGGRLEPDTVASCERFSKLVRQVEHAVSMVYELAVVATRREADLAVIIPVWTQVVQFCDFTLDTLRDLKEKFPDCGTPELHDLTLDYRLAAEKRRNLYEEEAQCQTTIPEGLFPALS